MPDELKQPNNFLKRYYATLFSFAVFLLVLGVVTAVIGYSNRNLAKQEEQKIAEILNKPVSPFSHLNIEARAVLVFDVNREKIIFAKNPEVQLPLASLTKVMTAILADELAPPFTAISVTEKAISEEGDSGLKIGEHWRLDDILGFTLTASSNDGARAISETLGGQLASAGLDSGREGFISAMNKRGKAIGLTQTFFLNETGLDISESISGAYGSTNDIAKLFSYAITKGIDSFQVTALDAYKFETNSGSHVAINTNKAVLDIPNLIFSKTGFTDLSGGNVAVAFNAGLTKPVVVVVLGSGQDGRFEDLKNLVDASLVYFSQEDSR